MECLIYTIKIKEIKQLNFYSNKFDGVADENLKIFLILLKK